MKAEGREARKLENKGLHERKGRKGERKLREEGKQGRETEIRSV